MNLINPKLEDDQKILEKCNESDVWGLATSIDLYYCDPALIRSADDIRRFVKELCELTEMRTYGPCEVVHFGEDPRVAGFSMMQLVETSLISAHFANQSGAVYLDIFSCKIYPPVKAALFAKDFFKAKDMRIVVNFRY